MKLLVGVSGRTGAGKTTLMGAVPQNHADVLTVMPGQACRRWFGVKAFAMADEEPGAPAFSEPFVLGMVAGASSRDAPVVLLDGFPRKASQMEALVEMGAIWGRKPVVVLVQAPLGVIILRLQSRDRTGVEKVLSSRRLSGDGLINQVLAQACDARSITHIGFDNSAPGVPAYEDRVRAFVAGLIADALLGDEQLARTHKAHQAVHPGDSSGAVLVDPPEGTEGFEV